MIFDNMLPHERTLRIPDRETKDEHDRALVYAARPSVANEWDSEFSLFDLIARPEWQQRAACRGMGPTIFYPERGESHRPAKAVCDGCPVWDECRAHAIGRPERHGIWAGNGERSRRKDWRAA